MVFDLSFCDIVSNSIDVRCSSLIFIPGNECLWLMSISVAPLERNSRVAHDGGGSGPKRDVRAYVSGGGARIHKSWRQAFQGAMYHGKDP